MVKTKLFFLLTILLYGQVGTAQDDSYKGIIGFDVIPIIAFSLNSDIIEAEFSYIKNLNPLDLRFKFNVNANDPIEDEIITGSTIEPNVGLSFLSTYNTKTNYVVSIGIAKKFQTKNINHYFGVEANFGLNTGTANSVINDRNNSANNRIIGEVDTHNFIVGVTPFFGSRFLINHHLGIDIEFGIPLNYNFGQHEYLDSAGELAEVNISRDLFDIKRFLNDVRLFYYF